MSAPQRVRSSTSSATLRPWIVGVAIGVGATAAALACQPLDFFNRVENSTYDVRVRREASVARTDSPVVVVEINESTIRALEPLVGRWPWPRLVHASAIDYLSKSGAKTIAYDVLFTEREGRSEAVVNGRVITGDESDRALVDSVGRAGNVILLSDVIFEGLAAGEPAAGDSPLRVPGPIFEMGPGFQRRPNLRLPFDQLSTVAAGIGHNYLPREANSDAVRRMLPFVEYENQAIPSLGVAAALGFSGTPPGRVRLDQGDLVLGDAVMPLLHEPVPATGAPSAQALIRFSRPTERNDERWTFPSYSFFDVLLSADQMAAGTPPAIPASAFENKLVFVGTTAAGMYDRYSTPFEGGAAGVELHAMLADNILAGTYMVRSDRLTDAMYALVAGLVGGLSAALLPVSVAVLAVGATVTGLAAWLSRAVGFGAWTALVPVATAAAIALFGGVAWRYFVEDRAKRQIRNLFGRYVSKDVIQELLTNPGLATLGGERREMTVLFSDIRGFTTASEKGAPEEVVRQLNEYFGAMVEILFRHQGTLDKFVGDMVMGLFGAPLPDDRHADHAVSAAIEMVAELGRLNGKWQAEGRPTLDIGIGINTGEMIAGNIGSEAIMSYTVIGDAVNLGSRLESLNKEFGTHILVSETTHARLTLSVARRSLGPVTVKGKTRPVEVFEVLTEGART